MEIFTLIFYPDSKTYPALGEVISSTYPRIFLNIKYFFRCIYPRACTSLGYINFKKIS